MITIRIDERKMKEMVSESFKNNIKKILENSMLEYWVRDEVHKLLSKELTKRIISPMLTDDKIVKMLQDAFNNYVYERFHVKDGDE